MILSNKFNKNYTTLFIYFIILLVSFFAHNFYVSIISSFVIYLLIVFSDVNLGLGIVFSLLPLSGIYDSSGFLYLFNLSVIVFTLKILVKSFFERKAKYNCIKCLIVLIVLILYELCNAIINSVLSVAYLSNLSIWFGYILLIFIPCFWNQVDKKQLFLITYAGFIFSCLISIVEIFSIWKGNIPREYRFVGLLRDPNYYSFVAIVLLFSSLYVIKGKIKYLVAFSIFAFGLLSVSKMFLLLCVLGAVLYFIYFLYLIISGKINGAKYFLSFLLIGIITLIILRATGATSYIFEKYLYRFETNTLTTGRDYIQGQYIRLFCDDIQTFLFGRTLDYNKLYKVEYVGIKDIVAHNTYLDLLMSFGLFGTIIYCFLMCSIFKLYAKNVKINSQALILIFLSILTLFALSYLKADNFIITILLILVSISFTNNNKEVDIYEKNIYNVRSDS